MSDKSRDEAERRSDDLCRRMDDRDAYFKLISILGAILAFGFLGAIIFVLVAFGIWLLR